MYIYIYIYVCMCYKYVYTHMCVYEAHQTAYKLCHIELKHVIL